jgi:hypothetical protein
MVDLLLSFGVDVNFKKHNTTLLHLACKGNWLAEYNSAKRGRKDMDQRGQWLWREYSAKRLIDSGCDLGSLKDGRCPQSNPAPHWWLETAPEVQSMDAIVREELLEYAHEKEMRKGSETTEVLRFSVV